MTAADSQALAPVQEVLRKLREIKGVRETRPGVFTVRNTPFAQFRVEDGVLIAELRKSGGSGFDRYPVATPPHHRKLLDDARLRAARLDDE